MRITWNLDGDTHCGHHRKYRDMGAIFDHTNDQWRYMLWREWGDMFAEESTAVWILHNPSTATEMEDDPTIRRCVSFSKKWGCNRAIILNRYAFRATDPKDVIAFEKEGGDAHGPLNSTYIDRVLEECSEDFIVCAWGKGCPELDMEKDSALAYYWNERPELIHALVLNNDGSPRHPLYVPDSAAGSDGPSTVAELRARSA